MIERKPPINGHQQDSIPVPKQLNGTTDKTRQAIGQRLAKVRREKGVTQVEMAKCLKTSQSMYSRYERGDLRLHADTVMRIAKVLGVTPNEVLGVTDGGNKAIDPIF